MRRSTLDNLLLLVLGAACIYTLSACSTDSLIGSTASSLVQRYCATPELGRLALREAVATSTAPNKIRVECADDAF